MSSLTLFPSLEQFHKTFDPFAIGFDDVIDQIQRITTQAAKTIPGYPPYNIKQIKDNKYVIEMAVAGFAKTDIDVSLEGNKLVIKASSKEDSDDNSYLYKGIANRNFERTFTLADKIEIKDAEMVNGMLRIWLENMVKTQDLIKKITIKEKKED
jgi:molecular chaperone IbpA